MNVTATGNTAVAIANTVFRTSSSYSISGTITLGAASPTKVCNILIDQDNNLSNGFTDGVQISCGSSTSVPFTLSLVPTGSFFLATHADNNDTVVNTGDYFGYHNGTGMAAPGAASVTVTAADVASVNLTPQLVP